LVIKTHRSVFSKIIKAPERVEGAQILKADWIDTPLGLMIAIADREALYLLKFINCPGLESKIERLQKEMKSAIIPGRTDPIQSIEKELFQYFKGALYDFLTPIKIIGSSFQKRVLSQLKKILFGKTSSYLDIAKDVGKPNASRAIGRANGANQLAMIIPCHRVIHSNGELGGYNGGLARKKWLLAHEKNFATTLLTTAIN